jgi:hypothetical protein
MKAEKVIQGRYITPGEVALIRDLLADHPCWNRSRLSRDLCERWDWRNEKGRLKDMACRTLLLKLEQRGEIRLPPRQRPAPNARRNRQITEVPHDCSRIEGDLSTLRPLRIEPLGEADEEMGLFKFLLHRYHYLGHRNCVGENLKYLVRDQAGHPLGCMLFGSAAWKAKSRDAFIGWDRQSRERNLRLLSNNTRFLILPWVQVRHLASHLLSRACGALPEHWREKYGHRIDLLETFVERDRFGGTCYRAAGWKHVGATTGRSRNDVHGTLSVPVKEVFVYPLNADFRGRLCTPACPRPAGRAGR